MLQPFQLYWKENFMYFHDNSTRMSDFLATIHLKERFNPCCSSNKNIDYLSVNSMLAPYIQDSYSFLDKVLND